jgi:hypothetical protein
VKWILVAILFIALAKAAYGDDACPKKAASFGFCVQAELMDHAFLAKDREELESTIRTNCKAAMKEYTDCDGIDKTVYVNEFVSRQVEFFKKDHPKAFAHLKQTDSDREDSVTN